MINSIDLTHLRNPECIQFFKNFTSIITANNPATLSVKPQNDNMILKVAELETLFKTATSNPITAEIEALDLRRDRASIGIAGVIRSYIYHYDPVMVEAATILQNNLNLYSTGIAQENYQSETAILNNLTNDWSTKPELQNAIETLGLLDWAVELKTVNVTFDLKYLDRTHEYGSASPENMKSKRAEAMTAYYALRKRLEAHAEIDGTEGYAPTINDLNALIEQYNAVLRARTTTVSEETNQN